MNNQDTSRAYDADKAHREIDDAILIGFRDAVEEAMLNEAYEGRSITEEAVFAQLIMTRMFAHPSDPKNPEGDITALTTENKVRLVRMAAYMGPDYAQALYHAAVFITKVA